MLTQSAVKWRYIYGILLHMENGQLVLEKNPKLSDPGFRVDFKALGGSGM